MSGKDVEALPLYNVRQKETVDDVIVNPQLRVEQRNEVKDLLIEYEEGIDKEIEDMLAMGIIERSEAPHASPLVLVKKPDGSYRVCVNFKDLNKITVFDPEPMMSPDDIFPKLSGSQLSTWAAKVFVLRHISLLVAGS